MFCLWDELGDENVVVDCVANTTANDTDGQGEGRNCGNEILIELISTVDLLLLQW